MKLYLKRFMGFKLFKSFILFFKCLNTVFAELGFFAHFVIALFITPLFTLYQFFYYIKTGDINL